MDYGSVPVEEFGAALLRGMGWSGTKTETFDVEARPHRLGLGATPKPMELLDKRGNFKRKRENETKRDEHQASKARIQFDDAVAESPKHLETVLPSDGGRVLLLRGPQKGHVGTLRSRDKTSLSAQVQLEKNHVVTPFHFNDITAVGPNQQAMLSWTFPHSGFDKEDHLEKNITYGRRRNLSLFPQSTISRRTEEEGCDNFGPVPASVVGRCDGGFTRRPPGQHSERFVVFVEGAS